MQDKRSPRSCLELMAKDQLEQHQPAAASDASAHLVHDVAANTNRLHKTATTHLPMSEEEPSLASSTSADPPELLETPPSDPSGILGLADRSDSIARGRAHEAALRRLNGQDCHSRRKSKRPDSDSVASTQPVLVKGYSQDAPFSTGPKQAKMRSRQRSSGYRSSEIPSMESFSFQDILASIDSDVALSIDKIAEICGRSKLSMADEYSSHMPPQSDFLITSLQGHGNEVAVSRLDPVEEASSAHEEVIDGSRSQRSRLARLSLANPVVNQGDLNSAPVIATSVVTSNTQSSRTQEPASNPKNRELNSHQLLAWLRTSRNHDARPVRDSRRDSGAADALQRILQRST
ncbi:MAG: hypothetical protein Q9169_007851 [Polycauliona sp. 2 TL-2023]